MRRIADAYRWVAERAKINWLTIRGLGPEGRHATPRMGSRITRGDFVPLEGEPDVDANWVLMPKHAAFFAMTSWLGLPFSITVWVAGSTFVFVLSQSVAAAVIVGLFCPVMLFRRWSKVIGVTWDGDYLTVWNRFATTVIPAGAILGFEAGELDRRGPPVLRVAYRFADRQGVTKLQIEATANGVRHVREDTASHFHDLGASARQLGRYVQ